jgi:hypothetical protein
MLNSFQYRNAGAATDKIVDGGVWGNVSCVIACILPRVKNSIGIPEGCKRLVRELLQLVRRSRSSPARIYR